jgi:hypothetical protein
MWRPAKEWSTSSPDQPQKFGTSRAVLPVEPLTRFRRPRPGDAAAGDGAVRAEPGVTPPVSPSLGAEPAHEPDANFAGGIVGSAVFVAAVLFASASWQLVLAAGGSALGRTFASDRGRLVTAIVSGAVIVVLAIGTLLA